MLSYPHFDVEVVRLVDARLLGWPAPGEAGHDANLGCNRLYSDLRHLSWREMLRVHKLEAELIARVESADDSEAEYDAVEEELYEMDEDVFGLDLGVASSVVALSAAGAVPFTSCNAGAFGGGHAEDHPLVAFFARASMIPLLLEAAEEASVGLDNSVQGALIAYADDIRHMPRFATSLWTRRSSFKSLRTRPVSHAHRTLDCAEADSVLQQLSLPFADPRTTARPSRR